MKTLYFYSIRSNERTPDAYEETKTSFQHCSIFFHHDFPKTDEKTLEVVTFMCVRSERLFLLLSVALALRLAPEFFFHSYVTIGIEVGQLLPSFLENRNIMKQTKKPRNFVVDIVSPTGRYHILCSEMDFCLCP